MKLISIISQNHDNSNFFNRDKLNNHISPKQITILNSLLLFFHSQLHFTLTKFNRMKQASS